MSSCFKYEELLQIAKQLSNDEADSCKWSVVTKKVCYLKVASHWTCAVPDRRFFCLRDNQKLIARLDEFHCSNINTSCWNNCAISTAINISLTDVVHTCELAARVSMFWHLYTSANDLSTKGSVFDAWQSVNTVFFGIPRFIVISLFHYSFIIVVSTFISG